MCTVSQEWADTLALEDRFAHRPNSNYGENIYCLWSSDRNAKANPREVIRSWYDEIKEHDFAVEPKGIFKAGHFTQLVWKSSQDLGVGVSKTKKGKVLVVCNYNPRGNIAGQFSGNVLKARWIWCASVCVFSDKNESKLREIIHFSINESIFNFPNGFTKTETQINAPPFWLNFTHFPSGFP